MMLKAMPLGFEIPAGSLMVSGASSLRQTRKKDLAPHFQKIGHENPVNSSKALSDTALEDERMV